MENTQTMEELEKIDAALRGTSQGMADLLKELGLKSSGTKAERNARLKELHEALRPENKDSEDAPDDTQNATSDFAEAVALFVDNDDWSTSQHFMLDGHLVKISNAGKQDSLAVTRRIVAENAWTPEDMGYTTEDEARHGTGLNPRFPNREDTQFDGHPKRWFLSCAMIEITNASEAVKAAIAQLDNDPEGTSLGALLSGHFAEMDDESRAILTDIHSNDDYEPDTSSKELISRKAIDNLVDWICKQFAHRGAQVSLNRKLPPRETEWGGHSGSCDMIVGSHIHRKDKSGTDKFLIYSVTSSGMPGLFPTKWNPVPDYANYITPALRRAFGNRADAGMVQDLIARVNIGIGLGLMPFAIRKDAITSTATQMLQSGTNDLEFIYVNKMIKKPLVEAQERAVKKHEARTKKARYNRRVDDRMKATKFELISNTHAYRRLEKSKDWTIVLEPQEIFDLKHSDAVGRVLDLLALGKAASAMNIVGSITYTHLKGGSDNVIANIHYIKGGKVTASNDKACKKALATLEEDHIVYPYNWHNGFWADGKGVTPDKLPMKGRLMKSGFTMVPGVINAPDGLMPGLKFVEYDDDQTQLIKTAGNWKKTHRRS